MTDEERERLRRAFESLPKAPGHGENTLERHRDIRPEWIMEIIADPYEVYESQTRAGNRSTVITGRVPESDQWIMVVFIGDPETGLFLTAYHNRQLEKRYGGRPWRNQ